VDSAFYVVSSKDNSQELLGDRAPGIANKGLRILHVVSGHNSTSRCCPCAQYVSYCETKHDSPSIKESLPILAEFPHKGSFREKFLFTKPVGIKRKIRYRPSICLKRFSGRVLC
jgi:hypothetical protein